MIPILETPRLILRPLKIEDFADYYEYAQDPSVSGPGMWQPYATEQEAHDDLAHLLTLYEKWLKWWALEDRASGKMIGRCELAEYRPDDKRAELTYALNSDFWGQGLMSEAARAVVRYGFSELDLNRISAQVFTDNIGSIRLLEKLGMVREGCLREYRHVRGKAEDVYIYSLLRADWKP